MNKFNIGDKVEIINYGSLHEYMKDNPPWHRFFEGLPIYKETKDFILYDSDKEIIGKTGIIAKVSGNSYAIINIPAKYAWYDEDQLKMVRKNPNFD